jgi:Zn-dependent protease
MARPGNSDPSINRSNASIRVTSGPGLPLGTVLGIPIRADWSLLFVFAMILLNLGAGVFPAWHPEWSAALHWGVAAGAAVAFFVSILLHELSHALVGRAVGVPMGGITLFMFGGIAHMHREPTRPAAELWMALVGPITSFVIGVGAILAGTWLAAQAFAGTPPDDLMRSVRHVGPLATLLLWLGPINLLLAIFNLLPGYPLDGGRVLRALLWWATGSMVRATRWASMAGQGFAWALIGLGLTMMLGVVVPVLGGGFGSGLWMVLIGWFLNTAARASYQQIMLRESVKNLAVAELMDTKLETVAPDESVGSLVHLRVLHSEQRCFPVAEHGALEGLICLDDVRRIAPAEWDETPIRRVMTPASRLTTVNPEDQAARALELLAEKDVDQIPVVDHGVLRGFVRRRDVARWVALHNGTG